MHDQDVEITTPYADYRKTETGYLLPSSIEVDYGGQVSLSIAVKSIDLNKAIDPAIFEMPKPEAAKQSSKPA
jgi:hypothetical protein